MTELSRKQRWQEANHVLWHGLPGSPLSRKVPELNHEGWIRLDTVVRRFGDLSHSLVGTAGWLPQPSSQLCSETVGPMCITCHESRTAVWILHNEMLLQPP